MLVYLLKISNRCPCNVLTKLLDFDMRFENAGLCFADKFINLYVCLLIRYGRLIFGSILDFFGFGSAVDFGFFFGSRDIIIIQLFTNLYLVSA